MEKIEGNSLTTNPNDMTSKLVRKSYNSPDEIISSDKEKIELVNLGASTLLE
jgi:hypothetical protein